VLEGYAGQNEAIGSIVEDLDLIGGELAANTESINSFIVNLAEVQRQTERLLRENRGNIDADLAHLANVATTLAGSREALHRTLCSLPTGVAPYHDTTSHGEWFNVRIVEFLFKDQDGNVIAHSSEEDGAGEERTDRVRATECPDGTPLKRAFKYGQDSPAKEEASMAASASTTAGPTDPKRAGAVQEQEPTTLGSWVDSLTEPA
jgi:ABC-type transporter Mla subunit MlaD